MGIAPDSEEGMGIFNDIPNSVFTGNIRWRKTYSAEGPLISSSPNVYMRLERQWLLKTPEADYTGWTAVPIEGWEES